MSLKRCCWILAAGHLLVVLCGACYCLPDRSSGAGAQALRWYASMSGADASFGFFAPDVGSSHRAKFLLRDGEGRTWWDGFDRTTSHEAWLRLSGIVEVAFMNTKAETEPAWRQRLVRSWAACMFTRHPTAVSLTVTVEGYQVPTMADYRAGARPGWWVVYEAQVQRHAAVRERIES